MVHSRMPWSQRNDDTIALLVSLCSSIDGTWQMDICYHFCIVLPQNRWDALQQEGTLQSLSELAASIGKGPRESK